MDHRSSINEVVKFETSIELNELQLLNIEFIFVTFDVSKFETSNICKDSQL